jgi:hypothetical protein
MMTNLRLSTSGLECSQQRPVDAPEEITLETAVAVARDEVRASIGATAG